MEFADWTRAFVMMAHDGTVYRPVLVDELGNLYALLQGETADEELRTVRLDDQGRISAFVIDSVDAWGQMLSIGNAELAARLGSGVCYERRGSVVQVIDFAEGKGNLVTSGDPAGHEELISPLIWLGGGYSLHLRTDNETGANVYVLLRRGVLKSARYGLEISFTAYQTYLDVTIWLAVYDGTHRHVGEVLIDVAANDLKIEDGAGAWHTIDANISVGTDVSVWHRVKVVIDTAEDEYVRLFYDDVEYDISTRTLEKELDDAGPYLYCKVQVETEENLRAEFWVDNIIVTTAEP